MTNQEEIKVEFKYNWIPIERASGVKYQYMDEKRLPTFMEEEYAERSAIYRWTIVKGDEICTAYIGQTSNLFTRLNTYRSGSGDHANRLRKTFLRALSLWYEVNLDILDFENSEFVLDDVLIKTLDRDWGRKVIEKLFYLRYNRQYGSLLNLTIPKGEQDGELLFTTNKLKPPCSEILNLNKKIIQEITGKDLKFQIQGVVNHLEKLEINEIIEILCEVGLI